jgi:hypothetical protein
MQAGLEWLGALSGQRCSIIPLNLLEKLIEAANIMGARLDPAPAAVPPALGAVEGKCVFPLEGVLGRDAGNPCARCRVVRA